MTTDSTHVALFAIFMMSGVAGNIIFLRMWSKLDLIGARPVSRISFWATAKTLREYRRLSAENSWQAWLPTAFWLSMLLALASGVALVTTLKLQSGQRQVE